MTREEALQSFLDRNGWGEATRRMLAADASFRTYERLWRGEERAVLMNAPSPENPAQFVFIDRLLAAAGARVPGIMATDFENGFVLLEDLGDDTFARLLNRGADGADLYRQAVEALIQMQKNVVLPSEGIPAYDTEKMLFEVSLLPDWFGKYVVPGGLSDEARAEFMAIWEPLIARIQAMPKTLVLLDFHVDNLMITADKKCGLLDFQDGRIGPVLYDLMSLIEDDRRPVDAAIQAEAMRLYFSARPELDTPENREVAAIVALQRHTKVAGIFVRLCARDGKNRYLQMLPFVWQRIESHLDNPLFQAYREWIEKYIPVTVRRAVPVLEKQA